MKLYDWQKIVLAMSRYIMFPKTKCAFVCENEEKAKEIVGKIKDYSKHIEDQIKEDNSNNIVFENGSVIEVLMSKQENPSGVIRGRRLKQPISYDDFMVDEKEMSEVLKSYFAEMRKQNV